MHRCTFFRFEPHYFMLISNLLLGVVAVDSNKSLSQISSLLAIRATSAVNTYGALSVVVYTLSVIPICFLSCDSFNDFSTLWEKP